MAAAECVLRAWQRCLPTAPLPRTNTIHPQDGASRDDVRRAYKRRLLHLHPDKAARRRAEHSAAADGNSSATTTSASATATSASSTATSVAAAFHRLQAAYATALAPPPERTFDALVASGEAFCRSALDEAIRLGLPPADVAAVQERVEAHEAAAAAGAPPPAPPGPEELLVWRRLHESMQRRARRQQRRQQDKDDNGARGKEGGWASLGAMVSGLLAATPGGLEIPDDFGDAERAAAAAAAARAVVPAAAAAGAAAAGAAAVDDGPPATAPSSSTAAPSAAAEAEPPASPSVSPPPPQPQPPPRMRRSWRWYALLLARATVAKVLLDLAGSALASMQSPGSLYGDLEL